MSDEIAVKVENLTKTYHLYNSHFDRLKESLHPMRRKYHRDFNALHNVSLEIRKGETVGIIGKNGSGKSTLLKLITGVLTPTSGIVQVNGRISALLELGAGFNPEMTGLENVYFNGTLMGYSREEIDARLDYILGFADIGEFVSQPVKSYSSGMFVRLAFAVALNVDPEILIVDEALSVGDIKFQRKCFSAIEKYNNGINTLIFVSHDISTITNLCNKSFLIDSGEIIASGLPRVIGKHYFQLLFGEQINNVDSTDDSRTDKNIKELRHGTGLALITAFNINDNTGKKVSTLVTGDEYAFEYQVKFEKNVENLFYAFVVRDVYGNDLFFTNTEMTKYKVPPQVAGDIIKISVKVTMWLAPGNYFLSFVVKDEEENQYLDRRLDALQFTVIAESNRMGGLVNLGAKDFAVDPISVSTHGDINA